MGRWGQLALPLKKLHYKKVPMWHLFKSLTQKKNKSIRGRTWKLSGRALLAPGRQMLEYYERIPSLLCSSQPHSTFYWKLCRGFTDIGFWTYTAMWPLLKWDGEKKMGKTVMQHGGWWRDGRRNNARITVFRAEAKIYIKLCINGPVNGAGQEINRTF